MTEGPVFQTGRGVSVYAGNKEGFEVYDDNRQQRISGFSSKREAVRFAEGYAACLNEYELTPGDQ